MFIDATHRPWLFALMFLCVLTGAAYLALPGRGQAASTLGVVFASLGTLLALFCALLPLGRKLQRIRWLSKLGLPRNATWEKGHIYLGLLGCLLLHCHAGFRMGGPLTAVLVMVLWAIVLSGLVGLLFRHLLPLVKTAKDGKALFAAQIIGASHAASLRLHVPLTITLFGLVILHAVVALLY